MNNPYRARPTKSRVDHTAGYGVHNQNMWNPAPRAQSNIPAKDTFQTQQSGINQSKQVEDPWDDSWNWNVDQQPENQQQRYTQPPTNQGQLISSSAQEHYYQNLNGNNKPDTLNQQPASGRDTPQSVSQRQIAQNHADSFPPYTNYNQNQQYTMPPRPSSKPGAVSGYEHSQWNEQQSIDAPYMQQRPMPQNQKDQMQRPVAVNNYNWNKPEQPNMPLQSNWRNPAEVPTYWHDPNLGKEMQHLDSMGNQCPQQLPQQIPSSQMFPPSNENVNKEHSINWPSDKQGINETGGWINQGNTVSNQWQSQNNENTMVRPGQQIFQTYNADNTVNSWPQMAQMNMNVSQEWQHGKLQSDSQGRQWPQQKAESNVGDVNKMQDANMNRSTTNDWQQNAPAPSHYSVPNMAVTMEANVTDVKVSSSSTEHFDDRKRSVTAGTDSATQAKTNVVKPPADEYHNMNVIPERNQNNSENVVQDNNDFNLTADSEWSPASPNDVVSGFSQLNLGNKTNVHVENQKQLLETHLTAPVDDWCQQNVSIFNKSDTQNTAPDNIPVLPADYNVQSVETPRSVDSQQITPQELLPPNTYHAGTAKHTENLSQSGYDQWYQNTAPSSAGNEWRIRNQEVKWSQGGDENVENCENIQQPSEFVNLEVVAPTLQERDIYGSRDSINKETLDNDPKPVKGPPKETTNLRDFRQEASNIEVPTSSVQQARVHPLPQAEQTPDNYEFASNDRNTFLETGELTDSHQEHEPSPPSQDDENDEVPNDIPFLREVPGQSSSTDPRRNDPTGQEQYVQTSQRLPDPRRNDPSGQEQSLQMRSMSDRTDRRDVPPGQERIVPLLSRADSDTLERRNDPSGRERSLPPQQSRNDPSGEERYQSQSQVMLESSETREVPGRGNEPEESLSQSDGGRQIPGGASPNEAIQSADDRTNGRVVTGSQEASLSLPPMQDQSTDSRSKREEAVGASIGESQGVPGPTNRRDSYEDVEDEVSGNSRDDSRERRRDTSSERRRYEYDRKSAYYDRDREYADDYYYDRRRTGDMDRSYSSRDDFDRRDISYRDDDRKHHSRDDLDRHLREDVDRRGRNKDEMDERDGRRRPEDRRRERIDDPRRRDREPRDYDPRYPRDRDYIDRDRRRDDRRPRRFDDYDYRRDYYDDPYSRSSRPSSRSSYNDRDREYYIRSRDPYYAYNGYGGYEYSAHYGNNYYAYLENLRRTNPAAYAEWYHKYYASQQQSHIARGVSNYPEDRASVHSGRSSCDERTTGDKRTMADMSQIEDSTIARMTPTKFSTSHAYGCFSVGSVVHVHPSYPADGERAKVDIVRLDNLFLHDPVARDLRTYPGPLIKGITHKKTIIEYCENKIKKAAVNEEMTERASYILIYELMIMLIQQNGNVVGVDIAALLLRNKEAYPYDANKNKQQESSRRESVISQRSSGTGGDGSCQDLSVMPDKQENGKSRKTVEQMTDEFRNTLLYGLVQEALESAMNDGLWGHALFLASKLDKRTHASVMTRFANSLPPHDPLQTLYQLHSGRVPAIVTCVADPRWDDWRPHLAMIISNTSANPEINRRSITTLGDTLFTRGDIYAAHFCYILAQIDFAGYGVNGVKLVLIGANHHKPYSEFMTTEAVMLTEIYEYARNLSEPGLTLVDLQSFKFDLVTRMIDHGLIEKALLYIEQIAVNIINEPLKYKKSFIDAVYALGDKIKYHDPICKDSIEDAANLTWLNNLAEVVGKLQAGEIVEDNLFASRVNTDAGANYQAQEIYEKPQQQQWVTSQPDYAEGPASMMEVPSANMQSEWQPLSLPTNVQDTYDQSHYMGNEESNQYQQSQSQDYWKQQQAYYQSNYGGNDNSTNWQQQPSHTQYPSEQTDVDNSQQQEKWNYEPTQPAISMTPSTGKQYDPLEELDALETPRQTSKPSTETKKPSEKSSEKKPSNGGGSWFGGLFSKLAPKPKNQMILPDDSNPTIVWDPVAKKWMNKDEDQDSTSAALAPPPKASEIGFRGPSTEQINQAPQTSQSNSGNRPQAEESAGAHSLQSTAGGNMYKLPKVRSMRANYIDVMNPNGSKSSAAPPSIPTPVTSPLVPMATSSPQFFVPAPVNDSNAPVDFLTPTASANTSSSNPNENASQGLSRWSSTSSLSREVQSYTMRDPRLLQRTKGPTMFNPNEMKDRSTQNMPQRRYPPR